MSTHQRALHILFVVGKFPELTFIVRTISALASRGHRVTIAARQRGNWRLFQAELPLPDALKIVNLIPENGRARPRGLLNFLTGIALGVISHPLAAWRLWRECRTNPLTRKEPARYFARHLPFLRLSADIVQFDFPMTARSFPLVGRLSSAATVVSCRGSDVHMLKQRSAEEQANRLWSLENANALHCVSQEMAKTVTRLTGRTKQIWVNRPAVAIDRIQPKTEYATLDEPMIICAGRLTWIKGYDYLLASLKQLHRAGQPFRAEIIGGGELKSVLRFSIEDLGLSDRVTLTGSLPSDEVLRRMRDADLFVLSSHEEGISNAALEAMASGLPIVTTRAGGMDEAVRDGIEGYVVPVRDIYTMAERIKCLLIDPALREKMGRAARARIEAEFSLERQAQVFEKLYTTLSGEHRA